MIINEQESNESFILSLTKDMKSDGKQLIMSGKVSIFMLYVCVARGDN